MAAHFDGNIETVAGTWPEQKINTTKNSLQK